ncbi:MAG: hypothetical protein IKY52_08495, partial [Clostridia bacterium]|nr:hypothetical protein [Clostridia bacterium]
PKIARVCGVTVDMLLGSDEETVKADIWEFTDRVRGEMEEDDRLALGLEYVKKYPENDVVLHEVCWILMWLPESKREPHLPLLWEMCEKIMNISTVQTYRDAALEILCRTCPDEQFEKWHGMCAYMYDAYEGEVLEKRLMEQQKWEQYRIRNAVNKIHLIIHFLQRPSCCWGEPENHRAWNAYRVGILASFGNDGEIPEGWLGYYAVYQFYLAASHFGCRDFESGWQTLEKSFALFERWHAIPDGTALELGHPWFFRGVKALKNEWNLLLPDGTEEYSNYCHAFTAQRDFLYACMTMPKNWEQFDPIRGEERYKALVRRAKDMMEVK